MAVTLPAALRTYMHSEATRDTELLAQCFASDAEVEDEKRIYRGIDAIREWKRATHAKYQYTVAPLGLARLMAPTNALRPSRKPESRRPSRKDAPSKPWSWRGRCSSTILHRNTWNWFVKPPWPVPGSFAPMATCAMPPPSLSMLWTLGAANS